MSKTIDEKVVEMRLENSNFEKNAATSISTLARLKQSLNLTGASKGLEEVNAAAGKVNMKGLGTAVETVTAKFSALQVMGVTALANLTNSVTNAAKNFVNALTIAPVGDGFREYEMTLNAVQTTMAATGKTAEEVELKLKDLDEYADKTIYSTADMLNNLPKFTNAGVALEDATVAMIGIANATALAGGDANKASIAYYNLGQAIGTGYLTRMDYNSINNAGIATMEWKEQMVEAAIAAGTLKKAGEDAYEAGGKTFTMQQLFIDGLQHQWATTDVMMKVFKDYGDEHTEIGKKAYGAAQDIKTFSMMLDSLKATAGTGWKDTWQIIFGGLDEAKEFWTGLNNVISGMIESMADFRNGLLEGALGKTFTHLLEPIKDIKETIDGVAAPVKEVTESFDKYNKVVKEVIQGDWGVTEERWKSLTEAGYDWATVQNMVNEELGSSVKHTTDFKLKQDKLSESEKKLVESGAKLAENAKKQNASQKDLNKSNAEYIDTLSKKTDEELKSMGLTDKQIQGIRAIQKEADKLGLSVKDFVLNIDDLDGRQIVINTFKNAWEGLSKVFKAIATAWKEVFPPKTMEERAAKLYDIIAAVHKFSTKLVMNDKTAAKLTRTFKGLFALISIISDIVGGGLKLAFKAVSAVLGYFDLDILDVTASIGDALVKLREATDVSKLFKKAIEFLAPIVAKVADSFKRWLTSASTNPEFIEYINGVREAFMALKDTDFKGIGQDIVDGFKNGIKEGFSKILDNVMELGVKILEVIKAVLGIHSPSTEFFEIGKNIVQGLINGLQNGISGVLNLIKGIGDKCIEIFESIDWGAIFAAGIAVGTVYLVKKIGDFFGAITSVADGLGSILDATSNVVDNFAGVLKSVSTNIKAKALKDIAIAIAILAGSVVVLSLIEPKELWNAVGVVAALAAIMFVLTIATEKLSKTSASIGEDGVNIEGFKSGLIAIGAALLLLAATVKLMGSMNPEEAKQGFLGLAGLVGAVAIVFTAYGLLAKFSDTKDMDKVGGMLFKLSLTMMLMVGVAKLAGKLTPDELKAGGVFAAAFSVFVLALSGISRLAGEHVDKLGGVMIKLSIAMALMIGVVKLAGQLSEDEAIKGGIFAVAFGVFLGALIAIVNKAEKDIPKIGGLLLAISTSMLILIGVIKLIGMLEPEEIVKGGIAIVAFGAFIWGLVTVLKTLDGVNLPKMAGTLLAMSVSIGIMAAVAIMLSLISIEGLTKGIIAVGLLSSFMALMIVATKGATDCMKNLIVITVAVAIMAAAVAALSMVEPDRLAGATIAMSVLMGMFAVVLKVGTMATASIAPLIVMTVAVGLIGVVLYKLAELPMENTLAAAASLSLVLLAMSGACLILSAVGPVALMALAGIGVLAALIVSVGLLIGSLGALVDKFPKLETFLDKGIPILEKIGYGLGSFVGNIIRGFGEGVAAMLPVIGAQLSAFMSNAMFFIQGAKMIDTDVLAGVGIISACILLLTATELITGIMSFLGGGLSLGDMGAQLSEFMTSALPFFAGIKMVDPASLQGVKALAEAILILTAVDIIDGMTSWLTGGNSLGEFGAQLGQLGSDMNTFATNLGSFDESKAETIRCAANAIKSMAEAAQSLPNEGGWAAKILGDNSIATFGSYLPDLGTNLAAFAANLGSFDETKTNTITCAVNAIKAIAQAAEGIPNEGGWAAAIFGDNSIADFGEDMPDLGTNLAAFAKNLGTFDDAKVDTVTCAANAIKAMAEAAEGIPNEGGWAAAIFGDNSIGGFGEQLAAVGTNLKDFAKNLGTFGEDKISTVRSAVTAINALSGLANADLKGAKSNLSGFGDKLVNFASDLSTFCADLPSSTSITDATNSIKKILDMIDDFSGRDASVLTDFSSKLSKIGDDAVSKFVKAFTSDAAKTDVKDAGIKLMNKLIDGVESKDNDFKNASKDVAKEGADGASSKKSAFKSAGKDLGDGLVEGIKDKKQAAYNAGYALGQAAVRGEKDGQASNSPSKLTIKAGKWLGEGLVIGMGKMTRAVYNAGSGLGETATRNISNSISRIGELISSDIDAQPTIRPVLDLSEISAGAGAINGMLDMNPSIGLMANVRSVGTLANNRQNGMNDDVISAIDRLGKALGNIPTGDTVNINGITYDDGSNVAGAIKDIVRAARMERRV